MGCHSEQKFAYDLINSGQRGGNYNLTGSLPPCPNCHGAMMRAANATGSTITYDWGRGNAVTYHPDGTASYSQGASAQHLQQGYGGIGLQPGPWEMQQTGQPVAQPPDFWGTTRPEGTRTTYLAAKRL